jgi:hypothetical protein
MILSQCVNWWSRNDVQGQERRLTHPAVTSVITLKADIRLRCTK